MADRPAATVYALTDSGHTLVIKRREPGGIRTTTLKRQNGAGPFTDADIEHAITHDAGQMQPGQRNISRRAVTGFGTLWTHVMLGPPTWWRPKAKRERDGTLMAGWLRFAVAVKFDRPARKDRTQ